MSSQDTNTPTNGADEQKTRSGSGQKFASLTELKRGSGQNNAEANRQSFTEQTKAPGSLGAMWDSITKGTTHTK